MRALSVASQTYHGELDVIQYQLDNSHMSCLSPSYSNLDMIDTVAKAVELVVDLLDAARMQSM